MTELQIACYNCLSQDYPKHDQRCAFNNNLQIKKGEGWIILNGEKVELKTEVLTNVKEVIEG